MIQLKCYLCDSEIGSNGHPFKIGLKEEVICEECYVKTLNRRKAVSGDDSANSVR
jgi:hypothetical protein